ncbi:MAG TPA: hypothetical protein VJN43_17680 [Bryobacteraceae bacterium]|nr:hypothetical protein [Bryobacteraceae bacterium]
MGQEQGIRPLPVALQAGGEGFQKKRNGVLVTFDTGVKELASGELTRHVHVLKSG